MMLDFYTIKTSVDMTDKSVFDVVTKAICFLSQPLILGQPVEEEEGVFLLRFAVRETTVMDREADLVAQLVHYDLGFTTENTEVIRADRI